MCDMWYVRPHRRMLLTSSTFLIVVVDTRPNRRWASCRLQISAYIGNFLTIETALESADQALSNGRIRLNEACSLDIPRGGLCVNGWPKMFFWRDASAVGSLLLRYGTRVTFITLCIKVWLRQVIKGVFLWDRCQARKGCFFLGQIK